MKIKTPKLSIFLKLILTVLVFGLLLNICVIIVFRLSTDDKPRKYLRDFMQRMEESIVKDIGIPPDVIKAKQICEDLDIEMRFESPGMMWSSSDEMPTLGDIMQNPENTERFRKDNTIIARYNGNPYSLIRYPEGVFIIKPFEPESFFKPERAILLLIIFISVIIILLSLLLRRLFRPLKQLSAAVEQIGDGNYNVKLPVDRTDELGELSDSINVMSEKIRDSIKAKQQLLVDVSHELRSPLTRIKLGLEVDSHKDKIVEDVNEMEKMVSSLLENYRADATLADLKVEKVNAADLLEDITEEYQPERIKLNKSSDDIYVQGDPDKLQMVFRNLIDNAMKYSAGLVEVGVKDQIGDVWITVKDSGVGISQEDLRYIYEPFYRADRSRSRKTGGFGLGLSICKKIVEAHKGEIQILSRLNEGTEVTLKFKSDT
jgi:signal transduction histidine kinase